MIKLCVFDLDGTLVDTISDLTIALNHALEEYDCPTLTEAQTALIVGHSVKYMAENAIPKGRESLAPRVITSVMDYYAKHCCDCSKPYEGVVRVVSRLQEAGIKTAVVTNKPHAQAIKVIDTLFPRDSFSLVVGRMERFTIKPSPEALAFAMDYFSVKPEETLYVGDSDVDVAFAGNANVRCIAVSWGYRTRDRLLSAGAETIVDDADELLEQILRA